MKKRAVSLLLCLMLCLSLCPSVFAASDGIRIGILDTGISSWVISDSDMAEGISYAASGAGLNDAQGHGTLIASIIVGSRKVGITGIAPEATIVSLMLNRSGEDFDDADSADEAFFDRVSRAIRDAIDLCGCRILNISSSIHKTDERLRSAVEYAESKGVLVVASAGNDEEKLPGAIFYPAGYATVVSVGAVDSAKKRASFSQNNDAVDLLALGVDVPSANHFGEAVSSTGTSFSAPIVAAAAAKIWTKYPDLSVSELRAALQCCTETVDGERVLDLALVDAFVPGEAMHAAQKRLHSATTEKSDYFYDAAVWAVENGVTEGTRLEQFFPNTVTTRAQMVQFLYRAAGSPVPKAAHSDFADVLSGDECERAVIWAVENGVVTGLSPERFAPDAPVTRAQAVTMLARMCGVADAAAGYSHGFADVRSTDYCSNAVAWAAESGITTGTTPTTFSPNDKCLHSQIITFLYRALAA